jgi:hypothetical protein
MVGGGGVLMDSIFQYRMFHFKTITLEVIVNSTLKPPKTRKKFSKNT